MNASTLKGRGAPVDDLVAGLTGAAYQVMLRHGLGRQWLDVELDLWHTMMETVRSLGGEDNEEKECACRASTTPDRFG